MNTKVLVGNHELEVYNYRTEEIISEPTGNKLRLLHFDVDIIGDSRRKALSETIKSIFEVKIPEADIFRAKVENSSWSYSGGTLNDETLIRYSLSLQEVDSDLPEAHNVVGELALTVMFNWIRTRAISELLVEKGIIEKQEYVDKIKEIADRDLDNIRSQILYGIDKISGGDKTE